MKITIRNKLEAHGLRSVGVGDFFRFANGKNTDAVFLCLSEKDSTYCLKVNARLALLAAWGTRRDLPPITAAPYEYPPDPGRLPGWKLCQVLLFDQRREVQEQRQRKGGGVQGHLPLQQA